jgi:hypothetical protein
VKYLQFISHRQALRRAILVFSLFGAMAFAQNPVPQIVGPVKPQAVAPGGPAFTLTVYGANFVKGATVNWNYQPRTTTFISRRELQAQILASDIAQNTAAMISVTNPPPAGGISSASFTQVEVHSPTATIVPGTPTFINPNYGFGDGGKVIADFNGDGKPDMFSDGRMELGNGDGTFRVSWITNTQVYSAPLAFGDFNGDGKLDLAYVAVNVKDLSTPLAVHVMFGDGTGKFTQGPTLWDIRARWPLFGVATGDFNGDGKLDLAVMRGLYLDIFLGNGDGSFTLKETRPFPGANEGILVIPGDFNGDGILDLLTEDSLTGDLYVLLGKGDGTFRYPGIAAPPLPLGLSGYVIVNDLNGDGKLDLIQGRASLTDTQIAVLIGNGDGTFQSPAMYAVTPTAVPFNVAAGDFNSDGSTDLVIASRGAVNQFSIALGKGDGTFLPQEVISLPIGNEGPMLQGDFNNDGLLDFLSTNPEEYGLIYLQQ